MLHPVLDTLRALGWTGLLAPADDSTPPRHVLLADAASTPLAPLMDRLLLAPDAQAGWRQGDKPWRALTLADVVGE